MLHQDFRQAVRWLRANLGFTAAAVLVLAIAIGATTATFTIVHAVLLRPLPFPEADRIIRVWSSPAGRDLPFFSVAPADVADWRARMVTASHVAAYDRQRPFALTENGTPEEVIGARVSRDLFDLLRVRPAIGRWFARDEDAANAGARVAVISHGLWQQRFGGRTDIVGQSMRLDDESWTIVGVMPAGFAIPNNPAQVWLPLQLAPDPARRAGRYLRVLARLRPGVGIEAARSELEHIAADLEREHPASNRTWTTTVRPLHETVVGEDFRRALLVLSGAVGLVLLIGCANVASLLLSRAAARRREMAVRTALGAARSALVRQMLVESLVLAGVSGVLGMLVAMWGLDGLKRVAVDSIPRLDEVTVRPIVVLFACLLTTATAIVFGAAPALSASRSMPGALRSRESSSESSASRARDALVLGEVALAVVLLVGSGLLMRSFVRLSQRALGFDAARVLLVQVQPPRGTSGAAQFYDGLMSDLAALPGVERVAGGSSLPFAGPNSANTVIAEDRMTDSDVVPDADFRVVTPQYFRALAIPLMRGRSFSETDVPASPVVIVSATAARRFWSGEDPMGRRVRLGDGPWMTIVGVAGDARYLALDDPREDVRPMLYVPHAQMPAAPLTIAMRTSVPPETLTAAVRATVWRHAPQQPISRLDTMDDVLAQARGPQRFNAALMTAFAWIALVLAAAGLWGLIAYGVARRTHEIGLRVALGARPADVMRITAGRGMALAGIGLAIGLAAAASMTGVLNRVLFGVSGTDPATFATIAVVFLAVAFGASVLPARRALRIDPSEALRSE
jgi:putative ABC transport system permease protein